MNKKVEEVKQVIRAYKLQNHSNQVKLDKIRKVIIEYRKTSKSISNIQWFNFYKDNKEFNSYLDIKKCKSNLNERYKQTCQKQVVSILNSYLSNVKNRFVEKVYGSSISKEDRIKLLYINKYNSWFKKSIKMKGEFISDDLIKLSRNIFKKLTKNKPCFKSINMSLDSKQMEIIPRLEGKAIKFDYWVKISTLEFRKQILIPLTSNYYFDSKDGVIKNSIQINLIDNKIEFSLLKSINIDTDYIKDQTVKLGLDVGMNNLLATNNGDLIGKKAMEHFKKMDTIITRLDSSLRKQGIKPSQSSRYVKLNKRLKEYLKNEINRLINRLVKQYRPSEISVENLDFKGSKIGSINNRRLSRFGKGIIKKKLEDLKVTKNIDIVYKNPAYTSQECPNCHYTNKTNRKTRDKFKCSCCGLKGNADTIAAKNIKNRSSVFNNLKKEKVKQLLDKSHDNWLNQNKRRNRPADGGSKSFMDFDRNKILCDTNSNIC
jgi:putative transposase